MNSALVATRSEDQPNEQRPEPIRVIRQGQWVILASEAELTPDEKRATFVAAFLQ